MTISHSTKIRSVGGVSVLAISAAFAVPALAQSATAPLAAAPGAPTTPVQPGNIEQCVEATPDNFVCAPGADPDGVGEDPLADDPADPITVTVQNGAFVTGSTGFSNGASVTGDIGTVVTNDGSIVGGADGALILNSDSTFTNTLPTMAGRARISPSAFAPTRTSTSPTPGRFTVILASPSSPVSTARPLPIAG